MAATKHNDAGGTGSPYRVPPEPNRWPSIALAVGMHALLLGFLWIGVSWQNNEPVAIEAEVWDVKTETAAPPPPQPAPQPEPEPETPPPPQPAPKAVEPPPPPPAVEQPAPKTPDIALEREKKRKQELKRQQEEERERELEQARAEEKRAEEKAKALAEKKAQEAADKKAQQLADQKAKEAAEKKAQELAKKEEADKKKKAEKEKAEKLAKEKADNAKLAKLRDDEMKRMMTAAGSTGSTGSAEKSTAPRRDTGYIAAITAKVKGNSSYSGDDPGNPVVTFHVEQLPTGEIMSVKMTKSSGIPAFDAAIERAIKASSPLPKKKDGTVERSLEINFKMKDMQ
jgi:colicin import membrane protein